jgi:hypothetical protein
MITIISTITSDDVFIDVTTRTAMIVISNNGESYFYIVGGLPAIGDLQPILDAQEEKLSNAAQAKGDVFNPLDQRWVYYEVKQFLADNPQAKLLLSLPPDQLETEIENRTAAGETLLLKTLAFGIRYLIELLR